MDALPPDPYHALGVAKDATAAAIKTQYRKLVLKFHPDKVQDEAQKQVASDQFHKIQTAYEIIGDENRRGRYDAQCKLADLRKDVMERGGGGDGRGGVDVRTAAYKMPTESRGGDFYARGPERTRVSPTYEPVYEERRPSYAPQTDYFDTPPRPTARKDPYEEERPSKRSSPRDTREKTRAKASKENERSSRKEKSRRTEKDVRSGRQQKYQYATVEPDTTSDSDEYERERVRRRMREEEQEREQEELRRAKEAFYERGRRQREEAEEGHYAGAERAQKLFSQDAQAREYIQRSNKPAQDRPEPEQRPAAQRSYSSKDKVEYIKRGEGKAPIMIRRGSDRAEPKARKGSSREKIEVVEEPEEVPRKPPTLDRNKSSPPDVPPMDTRTTDRRPPFERQRSNTVREEHHEEHIPQMKRADTMPASPTAAPSRESRRKGPSNLREAKDAYPSPESSPEPPLSKKYNYGGTQGYADDNEFPTVDGYKTEIREPSNSRTTRRGITRSPSPLREAAREKARSTSTKHAPPQPQRTTSYHTYTYPSGGATDPYTRPAVSRENSGRGPLYGEIKTTNSPRPTQSKYSPPAENVQYASQISPENIKIQTGYNYKPRRGERPIYSRSGSGQPVHAR